MSVGIDYTSTGLIANAARRAQIPNSQSLFQNADFLALMNDDMHSFVVPLIKVKNDEYFVVNVDVPLVANTSEYRIPTRAIGGSLRDVVMVDANGNEIDLPRLEPEYIKNGYSMSNNRLFGIYFKNDAIVFFPAITIPQTGMSLRWKYERMPNDLCTTDMTSRITALNQGALQVTVASIPAAWTTSTTLDLLLPVPLFTSLQDDVVITNIAGTVITLSAWPTGIAVGQYLSESRTACFIQLPYEAHKLVSQRGAVKLLEAIEDKTGRDTAEATYKAMAKEFQSSITPRLKSASKKIVNRSGLFAYMRTGPDRANVRTS